MPELTSGDFMPTRGFLCLALFAAVSGCGPDLPDPPRKSILLGKDRARVLGGWEFDDMGPQAHVTDIICDAVSYTCDEATAILTQLMGGNSLYVDRATYRIVEWRERSLTAVNDEYECVRYTLTIDGASKTASKTRTKTRKAPECSGVAPVLAITLVGVGP